MLSWNGRKASLSSLMKAISTISAALHLVTMNLCTICAIHSNASIQVVIAIALGSFSLADGCIREGVTINAGFGVNTPMSEHKREQWPQLRFDVCVFDINVSVQQRQFIDPWLLIFC